MLVLDTCGERASVSLHRGTAVVAEEVLAERTASESLLVTLRQMLQEYGLRLEQLAGVGIVHGPGSFTGVRVGLALAKGLCEAAGLPCAPVSRLAILAHATELGEGFALLPAGRGQVYARVNSGVHAGVEHMVDLTSLLPQLVSAVVAVGDAAMGAELRGKVAELRIVELTARQAIVPVLACLGQGGVDITTLDANYVRDEAAIYRKAGLAQPAP